MNFEPGKLVSLLDILGARYVCDACKSESDPHLTRELAQESAVNVGWRIPAPDGRDLCPRCAAALMKER